MVPIDPAEWQGIGRQKRAALLEALEDALLLGIDFEELRPGHRDEAQRLRAELTTVRAVEDQLIQDGVLQPGMLVGPVAPELRAGVEALANVQ